VSDERQQKPERFEAYLRRDDGIKTYFLNLISGSYLSDQAAMEELNKEYSTPRMTPMGPRVQRATKFSTVTLREWLADDELFAAAYKIARQMREEGLAVEQWRKDNPPPPPEEWPAVGRLDQRADPHRVTQAEESAEPALNWSGPTPYRDMEGQWFDGGTDQPLAPERVKAWEIAREGATSVAQ
jgi:hypothetical protein